jgi:hypothetical protein
MGTLFGSPADFSAALAGLAGLDVNALVTVGPLGDPAAASRVLAKFPGARSGRRPLNRALAYRRCGTPRIGGFP